MMDILSMSQAYLTYTLFCIYIISILSCLCGLCNSVPTGHIIVCRLYSLCGTSASCVLAGLSVGFKSVLMIFQGC